MSDKELVTINPTQHAEQHAVLTAINNALWAINDSLKITNERLATDTTETTKWLGMINETLAKLVQPPPPTQKGILMARFVVPADNPDFQIQLTGENFTDSEGNPTGAADIDLDVESSNADVISATKSSQEVSGDGNSITATIDVHVGASSMDAAVLNYKATNRDTSTLVASGSDEFIVNAGEASVGTVKSDVPLTPEAEEPPPA